MRIFSACFGRLAGLYLLLLLALAGRATAQPTPAWQTALNLIHTSADGSAVTRATAVDPATGAVFVTGYFTGQVAFGSTTLTSAGGTDVFVARYNPSTATWAWAKRGGGANGDIGFSIAADGQGGVYVTGYFDTSGTFAGQPALSGTGNEVFVVAYAASDGTGRWAKSGGGVNDDLGSGIAADGQGGVYVTGSFLGSGTFAGQPALSGTNNEVFVAAYAASDGTGRWAKSGGGAGNDQGYGIAADGQSGVYVTGYFTTSGTFAGQPALSGTGNEVFVAAYAASDGTGRWAKSGGGVDDDQGYGIAADGQGDVYVTGQFTTSGTFAGQPTLSGTGNEVFVAAYAAANGTGRWAQSGGGVGNDVGNSIATDGQGGVYVTGYFTGNGMFAGQPLSSPGTTYDVFLTAYATANGTGRWAASGGGGGGDIGYGVAVGASQIYAGIGTGTATATLGSATVPPNAAALGTLNKTTGNWQGATGSLTASGTSQVQATAVDPVTGAVFVTGYFTGQVAFGGTVLTSAGGNDLFVARYNPGPGTWAWAKSGGGAGDDVGNGIAADGSGGVYVTGYVTGSATVAGQALSGAGSDVVVVAYAADGTGRWAKSGGGPSTDQGYDIAVDRAGGVYVTGNFYQSATVAGQALSGTSDELFVAAYATADGTGRWAKSGGGAGADVGTGVAADGSGGVYVTGYFASSATVAGQALSGTANELLVAAYAAVDGTGRWAKSGGGAGNDIGEGIATDGQGGVYVTGSFAGSVAVAGQALSGTGREAFVAAYATADGSGRWAQSGGGGGSDFGIGIAADGSGGVYVTGSFAGSGTFAGQALSGTGTELFVAAYAAATGANRWAISGGGSGSDTGYGLAYGDGRLYVGGVVGLPTTFGAITLAGNVASAAVLASLAVSPTLTSLNPTSGPIGTSVTITGTNLTGATSVSFNGTAQPTITNNTGTSLTVTVPTGATTGSVTVTTPGGTSNGLTFTVTAAIDITSFTPASGPIGTSVTITGIGFGATAAQNVVFFGATRAAVTAASATSLTVTVPLGATYQYLSVTNLATGLTAYADKPFGVTLAGAASFQPKVDAATGTTPLSAATGDVTGDGKADVVTVNYDDNTVSVLRNTSTPGAVSFAPKVDYSTGQSPIAVAIGDLDGDGKPDLAVTNTGSVFVSVLRNTATAGAVGFAPSVNVGINVRAGSLAIGDVDGDGKPDLIVADFDNSLVLVLRNTSTPGAVSFAPRVYFVSGTDSYGAYAVAVGDVDGDGLPDLAVTNYSVNTVSVFRNTSTPGAVSFAAKVDLGYADNPYSVVLGDLDGDGRPDLTMTSGTSVAVFRNTSAVGTVSFAAGVDFSTGQRPYAVSMGDVDGDGLPDLAAAVWGVGNVYVLRNTSVPGTISLVTQAIVPAGPRTRSVVIGDMDGDGKPDLTTSNEASSTVSVLRQTVRLTNLFLSAGTLSPTFATGTLTYTVSVGNATSSLMVGPSIDNPAASALVNGTAVVSGTYSGPIALAVGSNTIAVVLDGLTYTLTVTRAALPTLTSFAPASGPAGTPVVISGTNLDLVTGVRFGTGTLTTNFVAQSATSLTVLVPVVASTGLITLSTGTEARVSSATAFTYTPRPAGLVATLAPAGPLSGCQARTLTASASSPAFATGTGFNNDVRCVVVQADGKMLVGGNFTSYNGTAGLNRLIRLNPNGSRDATFATGSGFNNTVYSVAVQADGKVLVGGSFTSYNGATGQNYLVRLNPNGSRDASFATGSGFNNTVYSVAVQADGKVLVGGDFTTYNGATGQSYLLRLNADGSRDATFNAGGAGFDSGVASVAVQADGKVLAGGFFTTYNYSTGNYLVRLNADGTRDANFGASGFAGPVLSVAVQADDQVLVGGNFGSYNGNPANNLVRLNAGGYVDANFNAGGAGFDSSVTSLAVQADGQVLVGGNFGNYNGTSANYLLRLDADGTRDATFNAAGVGFDNSVFGVATQADGKVLAGGLFTDYNGATGQNRLIRLTTDGSANTAPTAVTGASFTFSPGGTTTNPLVTSAAGSYTAVASLNGETSAASNAVVITACSAPTLTSISPTSGPIGTSVTITGTNLTGATSVSFNGTAQTTITNNTGTSLTVVVPAGATTGAVTVTTPNGTSNGLTFTVTGSVPVITSLSATDGLPGDVVTISGNNLGGATSVSFNGTTQTTITSNTATSLSVAVPAGTTTGNVTVTTPGGTSNGLLFTVLGDLVVSTPQSIQGRYRNVTVTGTGAATMSAAIFVRGAFAVQPGGSLNIAAGGISGSGSFALSRRATLTIVDIAGISASGATGAVLVTGPRTFSPDAYYIYNSAADQRTGTGLPSRVARLTHLPSNAFFTRTNPVAVREVLALHSNTTAPFVGAPITLLSDADTTAAVDYNAGGSYAGAYTVQRHVKGDRNAGPGYRHFGAPVTGATVGSLAVAGGFQPVVNGAYNTAAAPLNITPFPMVFGYDETRLATTTNNVAAVDKGYYSPTALTDPLTNGQGYTVHLAANQTLSLTGGIRTGSVAVPLTRGAAADAGWALVGNPFAAPFSLASLANTAGVDNAKYVFETSGPYVGTYRTYLPGSPAIGNPMVALGQAFFTHLSAANSTATLTLNSSATTVSDPMVFHRDAADDRPVLTLALAGAAGHDEATLYLQAGIPAGVDGQFDAVKLANPTGLNLATVAGGQQLAINGMPQFAAAASVPLAVAVPAAGTYTLQVAALRNLPASTQAVLVDALLNIRTDLRTLPAAGYAFTQAASAAATGRFFLNLTPAGAALASATQSISHSVTLFPNPARTSFALLLPAGTTATTATLVNSLGQTVRTLTATAATAVNVTGLAAGVYTLRLTLDGQPVTKRLVLE